MVNFFLRIPDEQMCISHRYYFRKDVLVKECLYDLPIL